MSIEEIHQAVLKFKLNDIEALVEDEIKFAKNYEIILNQGLIAPMDEIGKRFSAGDLFVPEMMLAAKVMKAGLDVLKPHLVRSDIKSKGTIIIGTVKGDLHDIGKDLVALILEGGGFKVVDVGIDAESQKFIAAIAQHNAKIVGLSALLTTTMPAMQETVADLKNAFPDIKVMVGGAPIDAAFAKKSGADGYGENAPSAVQLARQFLG